MSLKGGLYLTYLRFFVFYFGLGSDQPNPESANNDRYRKLRLCKVLNLFKVRGTA